LDRGGHDVAENMVGSLITFNTAATEVLVF